MKKDIVVKSLLAILSLVSVVWGAKAHANAKENRKKAKEIYEVSSKKQKKMNRILEKNGASTKKVVEKLGLLKLDIQTNEIAKFIDLYKRIKPINLKEIEKEEFNLTFKEIESMEKMSVSAKGVLEIGVKSLANGTLVGVGIYSGIMLYGANGIALTTMTGLAAQHTATLALLSGNAVVANTILGGMVAVPSILISGLIADSKAEKALTEAIKFQASIDVAYENIGLEVSKLRAIEERCAECENVLKQLRKRLKLQLNDFSKVVVILQKENWINEPARETNNGIKKLYFRIVNSFRRRKREKQIKVVHLTVVMAKTLKAVLDVSILNKEGDLTSESKDIRKKLTIIGV